MCEGFKKDLTEDTNTQEDDAEDNTQQHRRKYEKRRWQHDPIGIATRTRQKTTCSQVENEREENDAKSCLAYTLTAEVCPLNTHEALNSPDAKQWEEAMNEELNSLNKNKTLESNFL